MKAAIIKEPGKVVINNIPDLPSLSDYECLCKNLFAATCSGTDRKLINNSTPWEINYPAVLGHENVGQIIETGKKVINFKTGDLVLRSVYVYPDEEKNGYHAAFGGFSEYGIITDVKSMEKDGYREYNPYANYQMKLPHEWKDNPSSVIFITLKETFSWLRKLLPFYGKDIGIIGAGPVGLFFVKLAALFCAKTITVLNRSGRGFERARRMGADYCIALSKGEKSSFRFDLLIDAAGILNKIQEFIPFVKAGGTFAIYGLDHSLKAEFDGFGSGLIFSFHNSDEADPLVHETCISVVNKGIIRLEDFYSSVMGFDDIPQAYELIKNKKEFKVIFGF
jgi:L-iditol 2-dehydrogenase